MNVASQIGESHHSGAVTKVDHPLTIQDVTKAQWDLLGEHVAVQYTSVAANGKVTPGQYLALTAPAAIALLVLLSKVFGDKDTTEEPEPQGGEGG